MLLLRPFPRVWTRILTYILPWDFLEEDVKCLGLSAPIGTGPLKFVSREAADDGSDSEVVFASNADYWGSAPGFDTLTAVQYGSVEEVEAALKSGDLDMAMGIGKSAFVD